MGVFVDPRVFEDVADRDARKNRNEEYDAFDDRYVTFLLTEIIPQVARRHSISEDPDQWGICGGSSGGNCAFTAAWLRPDAFGRVIGFLSSFAQMPNGNPSPALIPTEPRKPLRVFLQAGHRDLNWNEPQANWFACEPARRGRPGRSGIRRPTGARRRRSQCPPRRRSAPRCARVALALDGGGLSHGVGGDG